MKYQVHSFRHASVILNEPEYQKSYRQITDALDSISDADLIADFESGSESKSISISINKLIRKRLTAYGWTPEPLIFQDSKYTSKNWRLDFANKSISVEVAFNHGEAIAWNLLKPVLASELNHVKKDIQTEIGVIICASKKLKTAGGFDSAVGEYEKFLRYLNPLRNVLTCPILLISLEAPETFKISHRKEGRRKIGYIVRINQ